MDPESLILASLMLSAREPRLTNVLYSWLDANATLVSVQRLKNLEADYPDDIRPHVHELARRTRVVAKHPRWRALEGDADTEISSIALPDVRRAVAAPLKRAGNLMLRLRTAMGVGVKADVLTVSLGTREPLTVRSVTQSTGYTAVGVRGALADLGAAGFLTTVESKPVTYEADRDVWLRLLAFKRMPDWIPVHDFFAFAFETMAWGTRATTKSASDYAIGVRTDALMKTHRVITEPAGGGVHEAGPQDRGARNLLRMRRLGDRISRIVTGGGR